MSKTITIFTTEALITEKPGNPLLSSLHEINAPDAINWWPQTLGWQLILLLICVYLLYRVGLVLRRYNHNAYRRGAQAELMKLSDDSANLALMPQILRSTALYAFERNQVAPVIGHKWEQWLDQQCKGADFSGQYQGLLDQLTYSAQPKISTEQLNAFKLHILFWIKHHRGKYD